MELAEEVDRYLRQTGVSASRFGRMVARDPSLVSDLRAGRRPHPRLHARILAQLGRPLNMPAQFARALASLASAQGYSLDGEVGAAAWASSGFVGEQAFCVLCAGASASPAWLSRLPDHAWRLPFLVADLDVIPRKGGASVTALLLPEA